MSGWWGTASAKTQFLKRLAARAAHQWPDRNVDPFMFGAERDHWRNPAQLEAVVEFYANFDDPWRPAPVPRRPGDANYTAVNFKDLEGKAATVANNVITLDGNPELTRVKVNP